MRGLPLAGNVVELQPAVCAAVHDALGAEDHAVIAGVQLGEGVLNVSLGELPGRLDAPAGEDLIGVVAMMMVMMAAAAMLVVVIVIMIVVVMMLMLVFIIVIIIIVVMVMAAAAMLVVVIVVVMLMMVLVLILLIVVVIMMMAAAAMLIMLIIVVVVMMVFVLFFLVLVGVLLVGLGSHSDQLSLEVVLGGHGLQDLLAGQGVRAVVTMVAVGFFSRSMATAAAIFSSVAFWVRLRMMQLAWLIWSS